MTGVDGSSPGPLEPSGANGRVVLLQAMMDGSVDSQDQHGLIGPYTAHGGNVSTVRDESDTVGSCVASLILLD